MRNREGRGLRMLTKMRNRVTSAIASRHVAGHKLSDALLICRWAESEGFRTVISPWAGALDTPRDMFSRYAAAIEAVTEKNDARYVSMKLDSINYDGGLFDDLVHLARASHAQLHIDSLGPETADAALSFVERAVTSGYYIGYTMASRWRRSLTDAERVADLGVPVRIVKGQWPDPSGRAINCRKNFTEIAATLSKRCRRIGVATHDVVLAREVLTRFVVQNANIELEQFFSLPLNGVALTKEFDRPYRLYISYGQPGIPYNIRFTLTRPRIAAWVLADFAIHARKPWAQNPT